MITLVQGPGNNISFKNDSNLFIKASGTKMSDAKKKNIFVEVDLKKINLALENNEPDPIKNSYKKEQGMRPSIETTMHAIMPHKYVLHVHCVNSLSWIVQKNYESKIYPLLKNIKWISVPYKKPGLNLSNALRANKKYNPDVIFLSNHGIIAGAETAQKVLKLIRKVSESLSPFKKDNII